jgi:hypothetical protein
VEINLYSAYAPLWNGQGLFFFLLKNTCSGVVRVGSQSFYRDLSLRTSEVEDRPIGPGYRFMESQN